MSEAIEKYQGAPVPVNPFSKETDLHVNAGTVEIESSRAVAEVKAAILLARQFPRSNAEAFSKIMDTCKRKEFAKGATYTYPRGSETVSGPSIRLAETLARCWGNLEFGLRELSIYTDETGELEATEMQAYCWDMETNVRSVQNFRVKAERRTRSNATRLTDQRDIYENNANQGMRRVRSRILAIIPPDVISAAVQQCRNTIAGDTELPLSARVNNIVKEFGKKGITVKHIETRLGHKLDDCLPEEYADLVGVFNSIKEGTYTASDYFNVPRATGASESAAKVDSLLSAPKRGTITDSQLAAIPLRLEALNIEAQEAAKGIGLKIGALEELSTEDAGRLLTHLDGLIDAKNTQ